MKPVLLLAVALPALLLVVRAAVADDVPPLPQPFADAVQKKIAEIDKAIAQGPYAPNWDSLYKVDEAPEWFRDGKFGIYFHWGVYCVPEFGSEWYPRHMYDGRFTEHHKKTYGDPGAHPYTKFVPKFTAEHFDADEWAELFKQAGARYAGPVAEHHDGYAMWDSAVTPWNAADTGPKRDLTGELARAIRQRGMRFVATFHHARNNTWKNGEKWTGHYDGVKNKYPDLLKDRQAAILYGYMPRDQFVDFWLAKLGEVIDQYQPDLIWFDSWLHEIPVEQQQRFLAFYYNRAAQWGRPVVVTRKQKDLPLEVAVEDFEKGRADRITAHPTLTDDTISKGSWCYTANLSIKSSTMVLHDFIDLVSKNGQLLLNISPKADGTIPDEQRKVLLDMGAWLKVNGDAIYSTRPWEVYGEGPTRQKKSGHFIGLIDYTARDLRYTRSKDGKTLYAITLGWPEEAVTLHSVKIDDDSAGKVVLLGHDEPLKFEVNDRKQLIIHAPALAEADRPCDHAFAFKLTGFTLAPQDGLTPGAAGLYPEE